jgi:hypothetical protein
VIVEKEATNAVLSAGNLYAKGFILTAAREDEKLFVDLTLVAPPAVDESNRFFLPHELLSVWAKVYTR